MTETSASLLGGWESFYVIVGSSAAALTGLNFVVVALGSDRGILSRPDTDKAYAAFSSPTIVHFCAVLLVSAVLSAPWPDMSSIGWWFDFFGIAGLVYQAIVLRRARAVTSYQPVLEDWIWHVTLPIVAYGAMLVSGLVVRSHPETALFVVAGAALLLLYIGIHNAWDTATWLALEPAREAAAARKETRPPTGSRPPAG